MKVSTRISLGFGIVLAMLALIVSVGIQKILIISDITEKIVGQEWVIENHINTVNATSRSNARLTMQLLLTKDKQQIENILEKINSNKKNVDTALDTLEKMIVPDEKKAALKRIREARAKYVTSYTEVSKLLGQEKREAATQLMINETVPILDSFLEIIDSLVKLQKQTVESDSTYIQGTVSWSSKLMIMIGVAALILGISAAFIITQGVLRQLGGEPVYATHIAQQIAQGNLAIDVTTRENDQSSLLFSIEKMRQQLSHLVGKIRESTDSINTASREIASGNLDLSKRTESQAASLEETASSMEQLTSTVKHNADNAQQANQFALSAQSVAEKGGAVVREVVGTMASINDASKKIVDIIGVIDGIAFQTNILALNAAVEAARAGEQGRGFAVVATEVRTLAQRSAAAAKEIKELISDSVNKVDTGAKLVDEAGITMNEIVESVKKVTTIMAEINAASREQSSGIEQVNQAVGSMDDVTQQNAALVEQAAAAAESLQEQAQQLAQTVAIFNIRSNSGYADNRLMTDESAHRDERETNEAQPLAERRSPNRPFSKPKTTHASKKTVLASDIPKHTAQHDSKLKLANGTTSLKPNEEWTEF